LLLRLGADPAVASDAHSRPAAKRAAGSKFAQDKQALLTFLSAVGLTPTPAQLARIESSGDAAEVRDWLARVVSVSSVAELLGE
jgi:hypothetical protein